MAGNHFFKVWSRVPVAVCGEKSRGDVRIVRSGCFTKVSKMGRVVLVGKKLGSNSTSNGGSGGR